MSITSPARAVSSTTRRSMPSIVCPDRINRSTRSPCFLSSMRSRSQGSVAANALRELDETFLEKNG